MFPISQPFGLVVLGFVQIVLLRVYDEAQLISNDMFFILLYIQLLIVYRPARKHL